ncbi:protein MCM10 homolog, partial [Diaphorina citri]|uniref:Protein MCM10 homolog n=1 Tax=Diaphorina citri TaxID=121845 RepID=A0A1S4EPP4_DIACI
MGLSKKTTWKSKVDTTKATEAVNTSQKFDVYAEPIFGMRIINPCLAMQDLKYKMTGRQPIPMHKIKQHVTSPDVDSIDWVIGGVIVGKSPPKISAKGSQYCIWTLSDLKSGLKTVSLFLFSSAFTSLWKTNVGTVVGVLNPSVMENSKSQDEACLSVNNGDKIMCWGTSKDYGKCKARKKDGENCTNFVNVHDCAYCVYHVKQEYKKFTGRSEFQSQGGGALTNLRNKVLGKNEVFYGGQSFMALKPAKKNPKMLARDNKLLQSLSKTGVVVSALANQDTRKSCSSSMQNQTRGKKIEDAERMRRLSGQPVYVSAYNAADQERNNTVTFKSIFQQSPSSSTSNTKTTSLQSKLSPGNASNKCKNVDSSKPCDVSNKPSKLSDVDDFFDFESNVHLSGSLKTPTSSNKLNKTSSSSPKLNTMSASKLNESNKSSPKGSEASKVPKQDVHSPITRAPKLVQTNTQTNSKAGQRETTSSSNKKDLISQPSQAATDISNYFAKKSASVTTGSSDSSKKIILSKDLRERKKQIARAKAESLIKHKGGIEKADPNSLKKNISKIMNKSVDLELEIEGDKKENNKMAAFKAMMNKTSRHMDLVDEAHRREEEEYFAKLEKKEQMEEKMLNTFKVECKAVRCVEVI